MGGINCPPPKLPSSKGPQVPALEESYINNLALYCDALFSGASHFFAANAKIEQSILSGDGIDAACELFSSSKAAFFDAQSHLGTVSAIWSQVASDPVDFISQIEHLSEVAELVDTARLDLSVLADEDSLQQSLWASPGLAANFAKAAESINSAIAWQVEFSSSSALVAANQ